MEWEASDIRVSGETTAPLIQGMTVNPCSRQICQVVREGADNRTGEPSSVDRLVWTAMSRLVWTNGPARVITKISCVFSTLHVRALLKCSDIKSGL